MPNSLSSFLKLLRHQQHYVLIPLLDSKYEFY